MYCSFDLPALALALSCTLGNSGASRTDLDIKIALLVPGTQVKML